jgi:hypothetical protein
MNPLIFSVSRAIPENKMNLSVDINFAASVLIKMGGPTPRGMSNHGKRLVHGVGPFCDLSKFRLNGGPRF